MNIRSLEDSGLASIQLETSYNRSKRGFDIEYQAYIYTLDAAEYSPFDVRGHVVGLMSPMTTDNNA